MSTPPAHQWPAVPIRLGALSDGTFEIRRDGAFDGFGVVVEDAAGDAIDLVAWRADDPSRWFLKTGDGVLLGERALAQARDTAGTIKLVRTPREWCVARWRHWQRLITDRAPEHEPQIACVLCWDIDLADLFDGVGRVDIGNDDALSRRLSEALRRWEPTIVRAGGRRLAA